MPRKAKFTRCCPLCGAPSCAACKRRIASKPVLDKKGTAFCSKACAKAGETITESAAEFMAEAGIAVSIVGG